MGNVTAVTAADGGKTTYDYDLFGRKTAETDPLGGKTTYTYDKNGNLTEEKDALGDTTKYTYDKVNRLSSCTDALGNTVKQKYNNLGLLTASIDGEGNRTAYTYDKTGNQLTETDGEGNTQTHVYDKNGNLTKETDALGHGTTYTYDKLNRLTAEKDALGNTTGYQYDANGNRTVETDALGNATKYTYDYEYSELKKTCIENVRELRKTNKVKKDNSKIFDFIMGLGGFIPYVGPIFDSLSSPIMLGDDTISGAAINKIIEPNNNSKITKALANSPKYAFTYTVYELYNEAGEVKYVGRTRQKLDVRKKQHWKADLNKRGLEIRAAKYQGKVLEGLSYSEARGLEQIVFDDRGGFKKLLNAIRPLNTENKKAAKKIAKYLKDARKFLK